LQQHVGGFWDELGLFENREFNSGVVESGLCGQQVFWHADSRTQAKLASQWSPALQAPQTSPHSHPLSSQVLQPVSVVQPPYHHK
jgi:hypothetical protein